MTSGSYGEMPIVKLVIEWTPYEHNLINMLGIY